MTAMVPGYCLRYPNCFQDLTLNSIFLLPSYAAEKAWDANSMVCMVIANGITDLKCHVSKEEKHS